MFKTLPQNPNFSQQEEEILQFWQTEKIFEASLEKTKDGEPYIIYDGPPTANARPPLHTMVPMSFKDLVGRYQTMKGRFVPRQAGWDTHGLPVEVQVEKAMGLASKREILNLVPGDQAASIKKFNEACRQSVWEYKQDWDTFVPRVGYWVDTEHPYITCEQDYINGVWQVFKQIWETGLVYKDYKVLPYCIRCGTALSAAEVAQEYQDIKDVSVFVTFPLLDQPGRSFLAWTTTPWTLSGNVALAVGAELDYVVVKQEVGELILAKARLEILKGEYEILTEMKGSDLVGQTYRSIFGEDGARVVAGEFVTTEEGSGIVHIAPMYGEDDFQLALREKLPMIHTVTLDGLFGPQVAGLAGLPIREALGSILTLLQEKKRLYAKVSITHSYPHCWRCKTPLVYYAKDSWFIRMSQKRQELVAANSQVTWVPNHIKEGRFGDFIREARDWAISRERFWGTPLPVWVSPSGKTHCVGSLEELGTLANLPADFDPHRPQVDEITFELDGETYTREPLVLDVWFDSGAMPFASGRFANNQFPADYIAEAIDQTRGWFNSLLSISTLTQGKSPYTRVVCMGHLVDEQGKKMSKSGPNALKPNEVFDQVGVDAIRWFLYTVNSPGEAKAFSIKEIQVSFRKSLLLVWNMASYFVTYANLAGFEAPAAEVELSLLDRWVLQRQAEVNQQVTKYLEEYDFMRAGRLLETYINELSTWYLRRSRKREDRAFFQVFQQVLLNLVTMLAPFTPFTTEALYQVLRQAEQPQSVHLVAWPELALDPDQDLIKAMAVLRQAVELGLSLRSTEKVKLRQPLGLVTLQLPDSTLFERVGSTELLEILQDELNIESVRLQAPEPGMVSRAEGELLVGLDLTLTEALLEAGLARELVRQLQNLRKTVGLQPGQMATLIAGGVGRSVLEPVFLANPQLLSDCYLQIDPATSWHDLGSQELQLDGQTLLVDLRV